MGHRSTGIDTSWENNANHVSTDYSSPFVNNISRKMRFALETELARATEPNEVHAFVQYQETLTNFAETIRHLHPAINDKLEEINEMIQCADLSDLDMVDMLDSYEKLHKYIDATGHDRPSTLIDALHLAEAFTELRRSFANHTTPAKLKDPFEEFLKGNKSDN